MDARPSVRRQPAGAAVSDQRPSRELAERVTGRNAAAEVRESEDVPDRLRGEGAVAGVRSGAELRVSEHERAVVEVARGVRPGLEPVVDGAGDGVSQRRPGPLGRSGDLGDLRARAGGGDRRRGGRQDEDEGAGESDVVNGEIMVGLKQGVGRRRRLHGAGTPESDTNPVVFMADRPIREFRSGSAGESHFRVNAACAPGSTRRDGTDSSRCARPLRAQTAPSAPEDEQVIGLPRKRCRGLAGDGA